MRALVEPTRARNEGHPLGGLRRFGLPAMLVAAALCACGARGPERPTARPSDALARPLELYRDLGFLTGPGQFPVVAGFSTLAGPADSTWVTLSLSLPNRALRFQREGSAFVAEYDVSVSLLTGDSTVVRQEQRREAVRVPSFNETARTDESVVHQQLFTVLPGTYVVRLEARDVNSSRGFRVTDTLAVPAYASDVGPPPALLVYEAAGRSARAEPPALITNPRHTVPFGGEAPVLYVEVYGNGPSTMPVRVRGADGSALWTGSVHLAPGLDLRSGTVTVPADSLPLGRLEVVVGDGVEAVTPLVLAISDQWMVANFEEVIEFLELIALPAELDSLRTGTTVERREAWERFWDRRDPMPVTEINEYRDEFFQRVRFAAEAFREAGGPSGWQSDRGQVYIVLGPPDDIRERRTNQAELGGRPDAEEWFYGSVAGARLDLLFVDRNGFGRFELVPSSAAAFRSIAERLKRRRGTTR